MTDHHHPESEVPERDRPTRKQLSCLRSLAMQAGESFAYPRTKTQASQEIERLLRAVRTRRGEARTRCTSGGRDRSASASAIRPEEITGYGSSARWA